MNAPSRYAWVAFLVCPDCGETWSGILPGERPGVEGPIPEVCPECDRETYGWSWERDDDD